uniref:MMS1_N domain-containing protein n=1 Tax=Mesocestoides corti TaxID=53468 RepID=A0A5K3FX57_MESCO
MLEYVIGTLETSDLAASINASQGGMVRLKTVRPQSHADSSSTVIIDEFGSPMLNHDIHIAEDRVFLDRSCTSRTHREGGRRLGGGSRVDGNDGDGTRTCRIHVSRIGGEWIIGLCEGTDAYYFFIHKRLLHGAEVEVVEAGSTGPSVEYRASISTSLEVAAVGIETTLGLFPCHTRERASEREREREKHAPAAEQLLIAVTLQKAAFALYNAGEGAHAHARTPVHRRWAERGSEPRSVTCSPFAYPFHPPNPHHHRGRCRRCRRHHHLTYTNVGILEASTMTDNNKCCLPVTTHTASSSRVYVECAASHTHTRLC